jgi:hypothetical protein
MLNQQKQEPMETVTMEGTRKTGRPRKRRKDGFEEDVNVVGLRKRHAMARDHREWKKIVLEAVAHRNRL